MRACPRKKQQDDLWSFDGQDRIGLAFLGIALRSSENRLASCAALGTVRTATYRPLPSRPQPRQSQRGTLGNHED